MIRARDHIKSVPRPFVPVEHHTAIRFAHWKDTKFRAACAIA